MDAEDTDKELPVEPDSLWGDRRQRDHPDIHTGLNLPTPSEDGEFALTDQPKYRHLSLAIHQASARINVAKI